MKKRYLPLFLFLTLLIGLLPQFSFASVVVDSYATTNQDAAGSLQAVHPSATGASSATFQAFTGDGNNLIAAALYLKKMGFPAGYLKGALYATTGTYGTNAKPTGSALETSTNAISMADMATGYNIINFTFAGTTTLTDSTNYCFAVYVQNATTISGSDYVSVGLDGSSPTHGGNRGYYTSSAWTGENTKDLCFYVYADEPAPTPTPTPPPSDNDYRRAAIIYGHTWTASDITYASIYFHTLIMDFAYNGYGYNYNATVDALITAEPTLTIFGYTNLVFSHPALPDWATVNAEETWFAHTETGDRLYNPTWGTYLMNMQSPGWIEHVSELANNGIAGSSGYAGVFMDDCWDTVHSGQNGTMSDALCISFHEDVEAALATIKAALPAGKKIICNTEESWMGDSSDDYATATDGIMIEGFYHAPWDPYWYNSKYGLLGAQQDAVTRLVAVNKTVVCSSGCYGIDNGIKESSIQAFEAVADDTYASLAWNSGSDQLSNAYFDWTGEPTEPGATPTPYGYGPLPVQTYPTAATNGIGAIIIVIFVVIILAVMLANIRGKNL